MNKGSFFFSMATLLQLGVCVKNNVQKKFQARWQLPYLLE